MRPGPTAARWRARARPPRAGAAGRARGARFPRTPARRGYAGDVSVEPKLYGCRSMTGRLERVLVRAPESPDGWEECGWRGAPDPGVIAREHEALCSLLESAGAEVVPAESPAENPDAIYTFDSVLVSDEGAILLNPGKELRRGEPEALAEDLERAGVPIAGRLTGAAFAEGGDLIRLDEQTLLAGRGYRTNEAGIEALRHLLPEAGVSAHDLPARHGRD